LSLDRSFPLIAVSNAIAWFSLALAGVLMTAIVYRSLGAVDFGIWAIVMALRSFGLFLEGGLMFGAAGTAARFRTDPVTSQARLQASVGLGLLCGGAVVLLAVPLATLPGILLQTESQIGQIAFAATLLIAIEVAVGLAASPLLGMARGFERFPIVAAGALLHMIIVLSLGLVLIPSWGLVGAAAALLAGRICGSVPMLIALARIEASVLRPILSRAALLGPIAFAAPLWLIAISTQLSLGTDVPIVARFFGPAEAGAYAIGALVPATALSALYALVDAAYPTIARFERTAGELISRLLLAASALAGLGFSVIVVLAPVILQVWVGQVDPLSVDVLRAYCVTWALNVPAHLLVLHAMATSTHRSLVPLVLLEGLVSFVLSITLAARGWTLGPAIATLVTLAVSNVLLVPALTLPRSGVAARGAVSRSAIGYGTGALGGLAIASITANVGLSPLLTLATAAFLVMFLAAAIVMVTIVRPGAPKRLATILRHGGVGVWLRQRREISAGRSRLQEIRRTHPIVWIPESPPLVTVRIATYNRGAMVRDRAIASALRQTYSNIEVVVVGDHCDAETEAAVRSVRDDRVRFENLAERGVYPADADFRWMVAGSTPMNRALDLARGDWIAPLDDDDEFTEDHVEALLDACQSRSLDFAYGIAEMETSPGVWERTGAYPLRVGQIVHAAVMFHRDLAFVRHAIDSWRLHEPADWNVWHRMRDVGARIGFVDHVVTRHYIERREVLR
jgi:O-antigen/teichoic acid export membrane protein